MEIFIGLLVFFLLFLAVSLVYDKCWEKGLSASVRFHVDHGVEDETAQLLECVTNDKFLPLPTVEVSFHMGRGLQFSQVENTSVSDYTYRRDVFALSVRQRITRTLDFRCARRGYYHISQVDISASDLFLRRRYIRKESVNTEFYVLPRPAAVSQIMIPYSKIMGAVVSRKRNYDDPFEFAGLREYTRRDPMKYINWKATARAGKMLVNVHESTLSQKVVLLLDMEGRNTPQAEVLTEGGVRIACSLARLLLGDGVEVELHTNGTDERQNGEPVEPLLFTGSGGDLALRKSFACIQGADELPGILSTLGGESRSERDYCVLISKSLREDLLEEFSRKMGKNQALRIIPYRGEKKKLETPKNVPILWMEV